MTSSNPNNGGEALVKALEYEGVDVMFGLPGGAILPVYDPILDSSIRHVLVRHEQGAGHMAEGYAHATGKPGVCMVTSGPPQPTSSPRSPMPCSIRFRWCASPARFRLPQSAPTRSRSATPPASRWR